MNKAYKKLFVETKLLQQKTDDFQKFTNQKKRKNFTWNDWFVFKLKKTFNLAREFEIKIKLKIQTQAKIVTKKMLKHLQQIKNINKKLKHLL